MLPTNLDVTLGTSNLRLTAAERSAALNFTIITPAAAADAEPVVNQYEITGVEVVIKDMYLQV
jgi:hypothetical protein